jgi:GT2 family glycosyltransferase
MDVTVIIVSYNSERDIRDCLRSVLAERDHVAQEVIVLDNLSKDATAEIVRTEFPEVKLLTPDANLGFAAGNNEGVRHARGEYILLLNPDTVILRNAVDKIVDFARANPGHGLYGGRTFKTDGSLEPSSCWGRPTLWSMAMFASGLSTVFKKHTLFDPESLGPWKRDTVREVGVITGCFLLAKKDFWGKLGGFDESYFMYGEDTDLSMRSEEITGRPPLICPDAELIHKVGQSSSQPLHKALLLYQGKASLVRGHWHGPAQALGLFLLAAGVGVRALGVKLKSLLGRPSSAPWVGVWNDRHRWLKGYERKDAPSSPTSSPQPA